ncbi:tetratricopeptide repeat protein [Prosthecomicrobium sp. N25]|uniref:tetratricopeptide repeat protein n=1 Tax=Prosthecomicrobium sp. N25 TaxID=3129254 RepID=UPI0030774708
MVRQEKSGMQLTGAGDTGFGHYCKALGELRLFAGDPVASVDAALAEDPDFVMAHVLRAYLMLLGTEPAGVPEARASLSRALKVPMTERERAHVLAAGHYANGRLGAASRVLEDIAIENPHDLLALQVGHQLDYFTGSARMLRDRIARALPAWSEDRPGYHAMLSMQAFGLEEMGQYAEAERAGRRSVELEPRDGWGQHAVAHVLEMQGRQQEGIGWMRRDTEAWSKDSFLAIHNWWHLALYHLELGDIGEVLALYNGPIRGDRTALAMTMIDASALLWRLTLAGHDVGDRWNALADDWSPLADAGNYAFNDVHAMMAFMAAGRVDLAERVLEAQDRAVRRVDDNALFTREVGSPVTRAVKAFAEGDYAETIALMRPVRNIAYRFGGSHAQRDVLDQTLVEAAIRSGRSDLAAALAAERLAARPESPLARLMATRAARGLAA